MASGPITSWEIDGETVETVSDFFLGGCGVAPKSVQMVTAAMKLKDAYSLEIERKETGTSLVAHAFNAGGLGLIPAQRARSHMPQLRPGTAK